MALFDFGTALPLAVIDELEADFFGGMIGRVDGVVFGEDFSDFFFLTLVTGAEATDSGAVTGTLFESIFFKMKYVNMQVKRHMNVESIKITKILQIQ